ncbi:hypothetical protein DENSPDRAFT_833070 [Dentipellis sp. KUC8613]|nr:hypothetical protein DENSPDRAFT_833070 [Dentipellis sp. KUC8613]
MPSPPIQIFLTTIASQPALRQRQEYILRILQAKKIPFKSYDLASDEDAKRLWRRKAPVANQQLPGILVGGKCPGSFTDFEEAVEFDELTTFLRLNDPYDPSVEEDRPLLPEQPIGVPGAQSPSQMAKLSHKASFNTSPSTPSPLRSKTERAASGTHLSPGDADPEMQKVVEEIRKRNEKEFDVGNELIGFGLQGVKVTEDDLLQLVEELGLEGDDAGDLVKGLSDMTLKDDKKPSTSVDKKAKETKDVSTDQDTRDKEATTETTTTQAKEGQDVQEKPETSAEDKSKEEAVAQTTT